MKRVHYIDNYLVNPQHPVTVNLIGAGGTGSQVLTCLARLDAALRGLGHPGLFVTLYDPDIVTEANIGRQLFGPSDLGQNKAQCLVTRINNFFGNDWKAQPDIYPTGSSGQYHNHLYGQHQIPDRPVEAVEGFATTDILHLRNPFVLDGFRKHADHGTGRYGYGAEKNKTADIQTV